MESFGDYSNMIVSETEKSMQYDRNLRCKRANCQEYIEIGHSYDLFWWLRQDTYFKYFFAVILQNKS